MFGKEFKVLKELPKIFIKIGEDYPEYFYAKERAGRLKYHIVDGNFGYRSLANVHEGEYAKKLRSRSSKILEDLIKEGYIELVK